MRDGVLQHRRAINVPFIGLAARLNGTDVLECLLLPPLGIMFGLLVAFIAAQVWGDVDRANAAVNREASSLRAVLLLSRPFPRRADADARADGSIHPGRIAERVAGHSTPARFARDDPIGLADALQLAIELPTNGEGQVAAQREIVANLDNALDARRQRILVSRSEVNAVKWFALIFEAVCRLRTATP